MRPTEPIVHADMDAFYASVEQRDDPSLRGRPVAVGGTGPRSVVAAASYEARCYGVASAMPMVRARRLCRDLVVVPPRFGHYQAVSGQVMGILRSFTPLVEPLSLDEAFLDVGGAGRLFGPPSAIGRAIRTRIRDELSLPCSIGIGRNPFLAKLCSTKAKPDGLLHLPAGQERAFLDPLPVADLWGAGPVTAERLRRYGFRTVGQLARTDERTLCRIVGDAAGRHLHRLARGADDRGVTPHEPARSLSAEETFDRDVDDPRALRRILLRLAGRVGRRLRDAGLAGRTVTLKVRLASFETVTRSSTLDLPTDRTHDLVTLATELLDSLRLERARVRLLGVGMSNLGPADAARQLTLDTEPAWEEVERAADRAAQRFGDDTVTYAALLEDEGDRPGRAGTPPPA